jgi:hypothetical protein
MNNENNEIDTNRLLQRNNEIDNKINKFKRERTKKQIEENKNQIKYLLTKKSECPINLNTNDTTSRFQTFSKIDDNIENNLTLTKTEKVGVGGGLGAESNFTNYNGNDDGNKYLNNGDYNHNHINSNKNITYTQDNSKKENNENNNFFGSRIKINNNILSKSLNSNYSSNSHSIYSSNSKIKLYQETNLLKHNKNKNNLLLSNDAYLYYLKKKGKSCRELNVKSKIEVGSKTTKSLKINKRNQSINNLGYKVKKYTFNRILNNNQFNIKTLIESDQKGKNKFKEKENFNFDFSEGKLGFSESEKLLLRNCSPLNRSRILTKVFKIMSNSKSKSKSKTKSKIVNSKAVFLTNNSEKTYLKSNDHKLNVDKNNTQTNTKFNKNNDNNYNNNDYNSKSIKNYDSYNDLNNDRSNINQKTNINKFKRNQTKNTINSNNNMTNHSEKFKVKKKFSNLLGLHKSYNNLFDKYKNKTKNKEFLNISEVSINSYYKPNSITKYTDSKTEHKYKPLSTNNIDNLNYINNHRTNSGNLKDKSSKLNLKHTENNQYRNNISDRNSDVLRNYSFSQSNLRNNNSNRNKQDNKFDFDIKVRNLLNNNNSKDEEINALTFELKKSKNKIKNIEKNEDKLKLIIEKMKADMIEYTSINDKLNEDNITLNKIIKGLNKKLKYYEENLNTNNVNKDNIKKLCSSSNNEIFPESQNKQLIDDKEYTCVNNISNNLNNTNKLHDQDMKVNECLIKEYQNQINKKDKEIEKIKLLLKESEKKLTEFYIYSKKYENDLEILNNQIKNHKNSSRSIEIKSKEKKNELNNQIEILKGKIEDLSKKNITNQSKFENYKAQEHSRCEKYYQNKLNSDEFKGKYITLNYHEDFLKNKICDLENKFEEKYKIDLEKKVNLVISEKQKEFIFLEDIYKNKIDSISKSLEDLKIDNNNLISLNQEIKASNISKDQQILNLESKITELNAKINKDNIKFICNEQVIKDLENKILSITNKNVNLESSNNELNSKLNMLSQISNKDKILIKELDEKLQGLEIQIKEKISKINKMEIKECEDSQNAIIKLTNEANELKKTKNELDYKIKDLEHINDILINKNNEISKNSLELEHKFNSQQISIIEKDKEILGLNNIIAEINIKFSLKNEFLKTKITNEISLLKDQNLQFKSSLINQINDIKEESNQILEKVLNLLVKNMVSFKENSDFKNEKLVKEYNQIKSKESENEDKIKSLYEENKLLKLKIQNLNEVHINEIINLTNKYDVELKKEIQSINSRSKLEQDNIVKELEKRISKEILKHEKLNEKDKLQTSLLDALTIKLDDYSNLNKILNLEKEEINKKYKKISEEKDDLEKSVIELKNQLSIESDRNSKVSKDLENKLSNQFCNKKKILNSIMIVLENLKGKYAKELVKIQSDIDLISCDIISKHKSIEKTIETDRMNLADQESDLNNLVNKCKEQELKIKELCEIVNEKYFIISKFDSENKNLKDKQKILYNENEKFKLQLNQLINDNKQMKIKLKEFENEKITLKDSIKNKERKISDFKNVVNNSILNVSNGMKNVKDAKNLDNEVQKLLKEYEDVFI